MNETNKKSISREINNLGWFQILAKLCRDFSSLNNASHHNNDTRYTSTSAVMLCAVLLCVVMLKVVAPLTLP